MKSGNARSVSYVEESPRAFYRRAGGDSNRPGARVMRCSTIPEYLANLLSLETKTMKQMWSFE
jgi:hypothetical protein